MGAVHGRSGVTKAEKATAQPGRWAGAAGALEWPVMTSSSSAASDGLLITKVASLGPPLLGAALLNALYTRMATTALASLRAGAPVTLREPQSPCAFCHGDRAGLWREKPSRGRRPRQASGVMPSRGEVPLKGDMPVETSTGISPLRGASPREGITPTAWRGLQPREGLFLHKPALSP